MVQANINARVQPQQDVRILVFGEDASQMLSWSDDHFEQRVGTVVKHDEWRAQSLVLPALEDVLKNPDLKKSVWRSLCDFYLTV